MKLPIKTFCISIILAALNLVLLSMSGCSSDHSKISAEINQSASLSGDSASALPANPLQWKIITSAINRADSTMSTLYGNDLAVTYSRTHPQHDYPSGAVLSLVTWTQQDDPRWFGARIPHEVKSVEFVNVGTAPDGRISYSYQQYEGAPLKKSSFQEAFAPSDEMARLLSQRAAVLP
jgi:hypothetical protein